MRHTTSKSAEEVEKALAGSTSTTTIAKPTEPQNANVVVSNGLGDGVYKIGDVVHVTSYSKPENTFKEWVSLNMEYIKDKNKPEFTFTVDKNFTRLYLKAVFLNPQGEIDH